MKKLFYILLLLMVNIVVLAQGFTLDDVVSGKFRPKSIQHVVSSADGNFFYQPNDANTSILKYSYETGDVVETIFDLEKVKSTITSFQGFSFSPSENKVLIYNNAEGIYRRSFKADFYCYDVSTKSLIKLSNRGDKQFVPMFSNDGNYIAYVENNNIYVYSFINDQSTQITTDGKYNEIINGATDWVYEEEFAVTSDLS